MAIKIMLDAGHYGKYNSGSLVGYYESNMTWELHIYLKAELEAYGFEVGVTRTDKDKDLEVYARGQKAKGYDLFISLHSNAVDDEPTKRVVVIHPINGEGKDIAQKLADTVLDTMALEKDKYWYAQLYTKAYSNDQPTVDYYGVIRGAVAAGSIGIIIEHSFHTNKEACGWLMESNNLKALARAEAATLAKHYGLKKKQTETKAETNKIYRVQTGAYTYPTLAAAQLARIKRAGFTDAFIKENNGVYRIQVGAFTVRDYAEDKLDDIKQAGFDGFIVTEIITGSPTTDQPKEEQIKKGDKVRMNKSATVYGSSKKFAGFVYSSVLYVRELKGDRAVVSTKATGDITGAVDVKYLTKE